DAISNHEPQPLATPGLVTSRRYPHPRGMVRPSRDVGIENGRAASTSLSIPAPPKPSSRLHGELEEGRLQLADDYRGTAADIRAAWQQWIVAIPTAGACLFTRNLPRPPRTNSGITGAYRKRARLQPRWRSQTPADAPMSWARFLGGKLGKDRRPEDRTGRGLGFI
ncbi:hypothetical protein BaRGS_00032641, partial [Batillaria attramentaria]